MNGESKYTDGPSQQTDLSFEVEQVAQQFPHYEVVGVLGRGGMGVVYKARQKALERMVAIKLLPLEISSREDFAVSFRREAQAMARLNHPNIVSVYDFGQTGDGRLYCVMEYVEGSNLFEVIHKVGLDVEQTLSVVEQVCAALGYAHGKGVVHRDIKPGNVLVDTESNVKVMDFGLARLMDGGAEQTGVGTTDVVFGTPDYMAPEQRRDMDVDHRADIYSLGIMTYEMLCGEVPRGAFQLPSQRIGCDARIDQIVLKAMQQSPEMRYQSTEEIEADIAAVRVPQAVAVARPVAAKPVAARPTAVGVNVVRPGMPVQPRAVATKPVAAVPQVFSPYQPRAYAQPQEAAGGGSKALWMRLGIAGGVVLLTVILYFATKSDKPQRNNNTTAANTQQQPSISLPVPTSAPTPTPTPPPVATTPTTNGSNSPTTDSTASSETKPHPAETVKPPQETDPRAEVEKWLATTDAQQLEAYDKLVTKPFDAALANLSTRYIAALDAGLAKCSAAGQLEQALVWRNERQEFDQSHNVGTDNASTPPALKTLRAEFRQNLANVEQQRIANVKTHYANYDAILNKNITLLTQKQRLDDALLLQNKRKELADLKAVELAPKTQSTSVTSVNLGGEIIPGVGKSSPQPPAGTTGGSGTPAPNSTTSTTVRVGKKDVRGEVTQPEDIATTATKGKIIRTVGTITKTIKSASSSADRFYVRLEPNIMCEFLIPTFFSKNGKAFSDMHTPQTSGYYYYRTEQRRVLRFENGSVFIFGEYKSYYEPSQMVNLGAILKVGSRIGISGQYDGDTPLGVEKGLHIRDCTIIAAE